jgi:outer membrane protein OmpA-like peptidoglycan-associated protein
MLVRDQLFGSFNCPYIDVVGSINSKYPAEMKKLPLLLPLLCCVNLLFAQKKVLTLPDWEVKPQALVQLNSPYRDINLSLTPDGRYLYFMSPRGGMPWSMKDYHRFQGKSEFDGDIWYSERGADLQWQAPQCLPNTVNSEMGEDEPNISADGQTVYFQSWRRNWAQNGGPYYKAELKGDRWGRPEGLGSGITAFFQYSGYATDGMSIAPNGRVMVIAAGPNYDGPMDLFISRMSVNGIWSRPERLDICTQRDERSVFIAADSKTLYFASNGWEGSGGLDIFKTTLEGGTQTGELVNIGAPFNTSRDDYGFVLDGLRNEVYFVRDGDIYFAELGEYADLRIKPSATLLINGMIKTSDGKPLEANVFLKHDESDEVLIKGRSNALTGEYSISAPKVPGEYTLRANFYEGYPSQEHKILLESEEGEEMRRDFIVDLTAKTEDVAPPKKLPVSVQTTAKVWQATLLFDFNSSKLNEKSKADLAVLLAEAKAANSYALDIVGHTDAVGTDAFNTSLSQRRADAVAQFFKEKGISVNTSVQAKGESQPQFKNDSEDNQALNRRVEVILKVQ